MTCRAVYDTVVFLQWAARAPGPQHRSQSLVEQRRVVLLQSPELLREVEDVLSRPELRAVFPHMTNDGVGAILRFIRKYGELIREVPQAFTLPAHPDDDHLFNLAVAGEAEYIVTFETRLLRLEAMHPDAAARLNNLAPGLKIVDPPIFAAEQKWMADHGPAHGL